MIEIGNVMILGDSFSTFEDYIPDGYATYYTKAGHENTDVNDVTQTWWYQLLEENKAKLVLNSSYSGTTVCNTGYNGKDLSDISFVSRIDKLIEDDWFNNNKIDTLFIFGGTNDSGASSPIGEFKYSNWQKEDLYFFLPAVCYLLHRIKENLPNTRIIFIINYYIKQPIIDGIKTACQKYGIEFLKLETVEINSSHPTIKGMYEIKSQISDYLNWNLKY